MNERIKEIEAQCWEHDQSWTGVGQRVFNREKFAELIVRECAEICKKQEYKYWRSSEEDQWTPIDSANAIEQYFGVE